MSNNKQVTRKSSFLANVSTPPDDANTVALTLQRENALNGKVPAKTKVADSAHPVPTNANSQKFADLLIERIGSKSAVRPTDREAVVSLSSEFVAKLINYVEVSAKRDDADARMYDASNGRRDVKFFITLEQLSAQLPEVSASTRSSGVEFNYSIVSEDVHTAHIENEFAFRIVYYNPTEAEKVNDKSTDDEKARAEIARIARWNNAGYVQFENFKLDMIIKSRVEVYPSRFDANGKYLPARKSDKEGDSDPEREIFVICVPYADGTFEVLRDQGVKNFLFKLLRRFEAGIVAPTAAHDPRKLFVWTPKTTDE